MRQLRPVGLIGLFLFALALASAQTRVSIPSVSRLTLPDWVWFDGDEASYSSPDFDDSAWSRIDLPGALPPGKPGRIFWLRTKVRLGTQVSASDIWFLSGKAGAAFDLFADGVYIGSRGSLPPEYALRSTHASVIHIPSSALKGGEFVLAIRASYFGSNPSLPAFSLGNAADAAYELGPVNFWNGRLFLILAALSAFLAAYSIEQFLLRRTDRVNLYYALMLIFIALYFYELGAEDPLFTGAWFRAFARAGLILSMSFLIPFMSTFFGYSAKRRLLLFPLFTGLVFTGFFMANAADDSVLSVIFTLSLLPVTICIVFGLVIAVRALKQGSREALIVVIGISLGLALSAHDVVYQVRGAEPFAWLQGIAFFALNITIFFALSLRQTRLKSDLENFAAEIERKTAELGETVSRLEAAGLAAAKLAEELEAAAGIAARSVEVAADRSIHIGRDTERQAAEAVEADRLVSGFIESIDRVNGSLAEQTESVQRTATAASELSSGAESVARTISDAAAFAGGLAEKTDSGERAAAALAEAMKRVAASSTGISEVVEAVNEFAERTNLLAMNAAIEAAHAGASGRGFAIIASEVKKLALSQSERVARIRSIVSEIEERVGEGARDAEQVRGALRDIAVGASETAARLAEARAGTSEQRRASAEIGSAMEALAAAGAAIREEAERQSKYSESVKAAVASIAQETAEVRVSAGRIAEESAGIVDAVRRLQALSARSRELTASLAAPSLRDRA